MDGCGYCIRAEQMLKDEIASGVIVIKDKSEAPKGVRGFPHFVNEANGMSHSGLPQSVEKLFENVKYETEKVGKEIEEEAEKVLEDFQENFEEVDTSYSNNGFERYWYYGVM